MSNLDPSLIQSYRKAIYRINAANSHIIFFIDKENPDLDNLLEMHDVRTAALITAHNPLSQEMGAAENTHAHETLLEELRTAGHRWLVGEGADPDGQWLPETSIMVLGIDEAAANTLAAQFGQNAYVWIAAGAPPSLVLVR